MDRMQDISRLLQAAGGTPSSDGKTTHFTYEKNGSIRMRNWTGSELIDDELIADGVRSGTSAPIVNRSHKKVFVVDKDSSIRCFADSFRDDEQVEEDEIDDDAPWNEEAITDVDTRVHPQSQLAVSYDKNTVFIFYQKPDGTLGCINEYGNKWKDVKLPTVAALDGTPLATCNTRTAVFLFYIGANKTVRYLENCEGKWKDVLFSAAQIIDSDAKLPGPALKLTIAEDRQAFERIRPLVFCLESNILSVLKFRSELETVGTLEGTEFIPFVNNRERNRYYFWSPYPYYVINKRSDKDQPQDTTSRQLWDHLVRHSLPEYQQESGNHTAKKHSNKLQEPFTTNRRASTMNNNKSSPIVGVETTSVEAVISPQISEQRDVSSGIPPQSSLFAGFARFTDPFNPFNLMGRFFGNGHNADATQENGSRNRESEHNANLLPQTNEPEMSGRRIGSVGSNGTDTNEFKTEETTPREAGLEKPMNDQHKTGGTEAEEPLVRKDGSEEADSEGTEEIGTEGSVSEKAETAPSELEETDSEDDQSQKIQTEVDRIEEDQSQKIQAEEAQAKEAEDKQLQTEELQPKERQVEERQPEIIQATETQHKDLETETQNEETHTEKSPIKEVQFREFQTTDAQTTDAQTTDAQTTDAQAKDMRLEDTPIKDVQTKEFHLDDIQDKKVQNEELQPKEPQTEEAPTKEAEIKNPEAVVEPEELVNGGFKTSDFEFKEPGSKSVRWAGAETKDAAETLPARTPAEMTSAANPSPARRPAAKPKADTAVAGGSGKRSDTEESDSESSDSEDTDDETSTHGRGPESRFNTLKEIRADIDDFVNESNLSSFFPDGSYLETVAKNAAKFKNKKKNKTKNDAHLQSMTRLNIYQPVLYCDDSTSMKVGKRVKSQKNMVRRVTQFSTCLAPLGYGTSLQFINLNGEDVHNDKLSYDDVKKKINLMRPNGNTKIGTNLKKKILKPLVYDVINNGKRLERPIFISCITDGCPSGESTEKFKKEILKCVRFLNDNDYPRSTVRFQISQIGNDPRANEFLEELRGEILRDPDLKEVLYCTTERLDEKFDELKKNEEMLEQWLLRTIVTPLMGERISTLQFNN